MNSKTKITIPTFVVLFVFMISNASAALLNGSVLSIDAGSNFGLEASPGYFVYTDIIGHDGIVTGTAQAASGTHIGSPDGTESPGIDQPWEFFGNTGMHWTSSPTNVLSSSGNTATLDFSGWNVAWNDQLQIPLGSLAWGGNPEGVAQITCGVDCSVGDSYSLYYSAIVPSTTPGAFSLLGYELNLVGTITAVPLPAAIWLFLSGALLLFGNTGRKKIFK